MEFKEFSELVKSYFNYKLTFYCLNYDSKTIEFILYDSFYFELSIGGRYGVFGAAVGIGNSMHSLTKVMGQPITLNSDQKAITSNMDIIDTYCRLRLPDKFLNEFDKLKEA
jgi:hypothetical protein